MEELDKIESYIRKSISEEQLAVVDYLDRKRKLEKLLEDTENGEKLQIFINTLEDIISEEKVHIGQLSEMLNLFNLSSYNEQKGKEEAKEETKTFVSAARKLRPYL